MKKSGVEREIDKKNGVFDEVSPAIGGNGSLRCGVSVHLIPIKGKWKSRDIDETGYFLQW